LATTSLIALLAFGFLDQTGLRNLDWKSHAASFKGEQDFAAKVQAALGSDAAVFQLPIFSFPEHPPIHRMLDYEHLKMYLLTKSIRWTYPAMRGRDAFRWQAEVAALEFPEFLHRLWGAGFNAIYIDQSAYKSEASIVSKLQSTFGHPVSSQDGRRLLFKIDIPYRFTFSSTGVPERVTRLRENVISKLSPPSVLNQVKFMAFIKSQPLGVENPIGADLLNSVEIQRLQGSAPRPLEGNDAWRSSLSCRVVGFDDRGQARIEIRVQNRETSIWPTRGQGDKDDYVVRLRASYVRLMNKAEVLQRDLPFGSVSLGSALLPGESRTVSVSVPVDSLANSERILQFDLVQERVAWFSEKGSTPCYLRLDLK
jgi:hypothetical protein